jgi:hypothetical protein
MPQAKLAFAPELSVTQWFNSRAPLTLERLRGRVILLHAFQMLCPGCVAHATPQAERAHRMFRNTDLQVIGMHTVFEHHAAMSPISLAAYISRLGSIPRGNQDPFRLPWPVMECGWLWSGGRHGDGGPHRIGPE